MTASNLWSALFFAMLISLALGCIFGAFETVVSAVSDQAGNSTNFQILQKWFYIYEKDC